MLKNAFPRWFGVVAVIVSLRPCWSSMICMISRPNSEFGSSRFNFQLCFGLESQSLLACFHPTFRFMKIFSNCFLKLTSNNLNFFFFSRRLQIVEEPVVLRRHPSCRRVHAEHLLGTRQDDSPPSRVREVRVLASPHQEIPMGRWQPQLVPRKWPVDRPFRLCLTSHFAHRTQRSTLCPTDTRLRRTMATTKSTSVSCIVKKKIVSSYIQRSKFPPAPLVIERFRWTGWRKYYKKKRNKIVSDDKFKQLRVFHIDWWFES